MKKQIGSIFLVLMMVVSGCATAPTLAPSTSTPSPVPPTKTPTSTSTLTPTPLPPTVTPTPTLGTTGGRIEGRVYRSDTNLGIANAVITLNNADLPAEDPSRQIGETLSDEEGNYFFDNLEIGKYSITVTLYPNKYNMQPPLPCNPPGGLWFFSVEGEEETMFALSGTTKEGDVSLTIAAFSVEMPTIAIVHKDLDLYCGL